MTIQYSQSNASANTTLATTFEKNITNPANINLNNEECVFMKNNNEIFKNIILEYLLTKLNLENIDEGFSKIE